ncbi:MAG: hypothetical protein HBSAPP03_19260 [Phycisphaerae bacterium]|nr:MAG: hypothetical protein HBSAPP03_19260 [Phycisphaerae bacterium]
MTTDKPINDFARQSRRHGVAAFIVTLGLVGVVVVLVRRAPEPGLPATNAKRMVYGEQDTAGLMSVITRFGTHEAALDWAAGIVYASRDEVLDGAQRGDAEHLLRLLGDAPISGPIRVRAKCMLIHLIAPGLRALVPSPGSAKAEVLRLREEIWELIQAGGLVLDERWASTGGCAEASLNNLAVDRLVRKDYIGAEWVARTILERVDEAYMPPVERAAALSMLHASLAAQHRYAEAGEAGERAVEAYRAVNRAEIARTMALRVAQTWAEGRYFPRAVRMLESTWQEVTTPEALRDPTMAITRLDVLDQMFMAMQPVRGIASAADFVASGVQLLQEAAPPPPGDFWRDSYEERRLGLLNKLTAGDNYGRPGLALWALESLTQSYEPDSREGRAVRQQHDDLLEKLRRQAERL